MYLLANKLGRLTGADGRYVIGGERYIPDVAYISFEKQPHPSREAYNPNPPDLAVEVLSPTNDDEKMRVKVTNYLLVGTIVWVVDPLSRTVEVYEPGKAVVILTDVDTLTAKSLLPNFALPIRDIFPVEQAE